MRYRSRIGGVPIYVDDARPNVAGLSERKLEKAFRGDQIAFWRRKSMVLPAESMALYR